MIDALLTFAVGALLLGGLAVLTYRDPAFRGHDLLDLEEHQAERRAMERTVARCRARRSHPSMHSPTPSER